MYVLDIINNNMEESERRDKISNKQKLASVLRFYATGQYQRGIGEEFLHAMSQKSVCNAILDITTILEKELCPLHIIFPTSTDAKNEIKATFFENTNFFGVIGCVDSTHVNILAPSENEHVYVNRHGVHSLNVQLVSSIYKIIYFSACLFILCLF